jgi:hypothetical protein
MYTAASLLLTQQRNIQTAPTAEQVTTAAALPQQLTRSD